MVHRRQFTTLRMWMPTALGSNLLTICPVALFATEIKTFPPTISGNEANATVMRTTSRSLLRGLPSPLSTMMVRAEQALTRMSWLFSKGQPSRTQTRRNNFQLWLKYRLTLSFISHSLHSARITTFLNCVLLSASSRSSRNRNKVFPVHPNTSVCPVRTMRLRSFLQCRSRLPMLCTMIPRNKRLKIKPMTLKAMTMIRIETGSVAAMPVCVPGSKNNPHEIHKACCNEVSYASVPGVVIHARAPKNTSVTAVSMQRVIWPAYSPRNQSRG
mmetsp:Transcript_63259/g.135945  ORF Transcript_63259/g.135945 Transcript_63259/m.135945 type:complete len:271 (+) Transcript_63259:1483-2295(+)